MTLSRRRLLLIARWGAAAIVLAVVLSRLDLAGVIELATRANLVLVALAIAGLVAIHVVAVAGWRRLLRSLAGAELRWRPGLRLYYAGQAIGSLTPGNVGSDVYRTVALDVAAGRRALAGVILVQRLAGTIALGFLAALAAWLLRQELLPAVAVGDQAMSALASVAAVAAVGIGLLLARSRRWRSVVIDGFGLGVVFHGGSIALGALMVVAVDPTSTERLPGILAAVAIARLSLVLPLTPSGLGVQEGVLGVLFVQLGLPAEVAVAAMLLNRLAMLATVLLGTAVLAVGGRPERVPASRAGWGTKPGLADQTLRR